MKNFKNNGYALVMTLWIVVVMIIISTTLLITSANNFFVINNYKMKKQFITLAESGINEAITNLINDKNWGNMTITFRNGGWLHKQITGGIASEKV